MSRMKQEGPETVQAVGLEYTLRRNVSRTLNAILMSFFIVTATPVFFTPTATSFDIGQSRNVARRNAV